MDLLTSFQAYLASGKKPASPATVKNYLADARLLLRWYSSTFKTELALENITNDVISSYIQHLKSSSANSSSSIERRVSSLKKFTSFLNDSKGARITLFENASGANLIPDAWRMSEFVSHMRSSSSSDVTLKNYLGDIKQFVNWFARNVSHSSAEDVKAELISTIDEEIVSQYVEFLSLATLSPASINRKLSSLRKYLNFIGNKTSVDNLSHESPITLNGITQQEGVIAHTEIASPQDAHVMKASKAYSSFPPLRLMQKLGRAGTLAFDATIVAGSAVALEKMQYLSWILLGKQIFASSARLAGDESKRVKSGLGLGTKILSNIKLPSEDISMQKTDSLFTNPIGKKSLSVLSRLHPSHPAFATLPTHHKILGHARHTRPSWYKRYHSHALVHYFHFAALILIMGGIGFGLYRSFVESPQKDKILAAAPTAPPRILSFQGRLTDSSDNPITSAKDLRFAIYNSDSASGAALLWQETQYITADTDGIFSVLLGSSVAIPASVFNDNSGLYLGITVQSDSELTPRQQIATVAFAANSETLQGLYPITAGGAGTTNVVLALDSSGNLTIGGAATPRFEATGGAFTLSGNILNLTTTSGSNANININPDGRGLIEIQKPARNSTLNNNIPSAAGALEIDDMFAVLATSAAQNAVTFVQAGAGPIFSASAGATTRFLLANNGTITASGYSTGVAQFNSSGVLSSSALNLAGGASYISGSLPAGNGGTGIGTYAVGDILYASGTTTLSALNIGASGRVLTVSGGIPAWIDPAGLSSSYWQRNLGALSPSNITDNILVGGSASTSAKFQVFGLSKDAGAITAGTASTSGDLTFAGSAAQDINILNGNAFNIKTSAGGDGGLNTKITILNNGNVGIGTTNPISPLHLSASPGDNVADEAAIYVDSTITNVTNSSWGISSKPYIAPASASTALFGGLVFVPVSDSNNLTNGAMAGLYGGPYYYGTGTVGTMYGGFFQNQLDAAGTITNAYGVYISNPFRSAGTITNNVGLQIEAQANGTNNAGLIIGEATGTKNVNLLIGTTSVPTGSFSIYNSSTDTNYFAGNVGLGTSSPLARLDVRGTTGTTTTASVSALSSFAAMVVDNSGVGDIFAASKSGDTKFVIKNSGNVGIGTILPSQLFHVNGGTGIVAQFSGRVIGGDAASSNEFVTLGQLTGGAGYWQLSGNALSPSISTYDLLLGATSTSSAKFGFINNAGGTPTATISSNFSIQVPTGGANATKMNILNGGSFGLRTSVGGDAGASERLTILNGGNVGIGTTAPGNLFDIGSFATNATVSASINANTSMNTQLKFREADDTFGASIMYEGSDNQLQLRTYNGDSQGSAAFTLSRSSGNIAIGTTSTSNFKLKLAGSIGPETDDTYDLGSSSRRWRDLYLGPSSLHIGTDLNEAIIRYNTTSNYLGIDSDGNGTPESIFTDAGNVGIGTTTAATFMLEVAGSIGPTVTNTYDLGSLSKQFNNTYTQNLYINGSLVNPSGLTNYWQRALGAVSPANITDDLLVGGSASTSAKFQVFGLSKDAGAITAGTASTSGNLTFNGASATQNINILKGANLTFRNATTGQGDAGLTDRMTLASNGNVGIGSTTPGARLDLGFSPTVPGNMRLSSYTYLGNLYSSGAFVFGYNAKANESATGNVLVANTNSTVGYQYIKIDYTGGIQFHAIAGSVTAGNVAASERMRIDPNGNVGIGTTVPVAKLDLEGSTTLAQGQSLFQINQLSTGDIMTASASGTTRFVINASGNVGLNNSNPRTDLAMGTDIGTFNGISIGAAANRDIRIGQDSTHNLVLAWKYNATAGSAYSVIENYAGNNMLGIQTNGGNVGIGTTTTTATLELTSSTAPDFKINSGASAAQISLNNSNREWWIQADDSPDLFAIEDRTAGNLVRLAINASGNVGIGTITPVGLLHLDGRVTGKALALFNETGNQDIFTASASGTPRFVIRNNGNVGIGTMLPGAPLDVTGDIYLSSGLSTYRTAVSDGTIEATQFCTGDGETNCVSDFSSIVAGAGYWKKSAGNLSPFTLNDTLSATSGASTVATFTTNNPGGTLSNNTLIQHTAAGTVTNLLNLTQSAGTVSNGLTFTGTFGNLISATNFSVTNAGALTAVGVNSGSGLIQGSGGITITGNTNLSATAGNTVSLGNTTGAMTLVSGGTSSWNNTAGNLTIQTLTSGTMAIDSAGALNLGTTNSTSTTLGKAATTLTINPTAWTATPTISGLITATSGLTANGALTANNTFTLGDNGDTGSIDTSDWDISTTGVMTGISGITTNGVYTQSGSSQNTFTGNVDATLGLDVTGANLTVADDLYVSSGISLFSTAVSNGTIEATQFCTGDGETNCISSFATLVNYWQRALGAVSPANITDDLLVGGSASTSAKFQVFGLSKDAGAITAGTASTSGDLTFGGSSAQNINVLNGNAFNIRTSVGGDAGLATRLTILNNGSIGIGTTSPLARFDLRGLSTTSIASISGLTSNALLALDNNGVGDIFAASKSGDLKFVIKNSGNVGIGTSLPTAKLALAGGNFTHTASGNPVSMATITCTFTVCQSTYAVGKYTYAGGYTSDGPDQISSFVIYDNSRPTSPVEVGRYDYNGDSSGFNDIVVNGRYAYGAVGNLGLLILDISNPSNPRLVGSYNTDGYAGGIHVSGKYAYVADFAQGLKIIDVSDPANPVLVSTRITSNAAYAVSVVNNFAYVADGTSGLTVIDVSNPNNPVTAGTRDTAGTAVGIDVSGRYAYVADSTSGLAIINISNPYSPASPTTLSSTNAQEVMVAGNYAYLSDYSGGFKVIDVSNPSSPSLVGTLSAGNVNGAFISGKYAYLASDFEMRVVDINGISTPSISTGNIATNDFTVTRDGNIAGNLYVGTGLNVGSGGLQLAGPIALSSTTSAQLSISGRMAGKALAILNETGNQAIFTASASGATKFIIDNAGNVGIGTISPAAPLDVVGDIYASSGISLYNTAVSDDTIEAAKFCTGDGETNCVTDFSSLTAGASYWRRASGALNPANITDDLLIGGGASTSATFQVLALSKDSGAITAGTASTSGDLTFRGIASDINLLNNAVFSIKNSIGGDAGLTTRLMIAANGNVGIGTTTPIGKLHLEGAATGRALATFNETGGQDIFTASASGTSRFVIRNSGNVGIGTTLPGQLLSVAGFIEAQRLVDSSNNNYFIDPAATGVSLTTAGFSGLGTQAPVTFLHVDGATTLAQGQSLGILNQTGASDIFTASTSGTTRFLIRASGNIGVGSLTNPLGLFSVTGSTTTAQGQALFQINQTGTADIFTASTSGAMKFVINNNGNVGIGTTAPIGLLQIEGRVTGKALALFNETGNQDIFTASASGSTKFTIANNGDLILGGRDLATIPQSGTLRSMTTTGTNAGGSHLYIAAGPGTGTGLGGDLVFKTAAGATSSAALVGDRLRTSSLYSSTGPGLVFNQTVSGSNPVLVVGVAYRDTATITVRFRGVDLTEIGTEVGSAGQYVRQFYMVNPAPGTGQIHVFSSDTTQAMAASAVTLNNVDTVTPYTNTQTATGTSTTPSVTVTSANNDLVIGVAAHNDTGNCSPGTFDAEVADIDSGLATDPGLCSDTEQAGSTSTTISHTTSNQPWTIRATAFRPTQTTTNTALIERLRITQNGNVGIGISSPSAALSIAGGIYMESPIGSVNIYPGQDISALNPGTTTTGTVYEGAASRHLIFDLKNNSQTDAIAFRYSAANTASVDSIGFVMKGNGNIGIGSTAPTQKLDLVGSAIFSGNVGIGTTTVTDSNLEIANSGAAGKYINLKNTGTGGSSVYLMSTNNSSSLGENGFVIDDTNTSGSGAAFRLYLGTVVADIAGDVQLNANQTATANGLCHSGANTATTFSDRYIVACSGAPTDIAEFYPGTADANPGDLMMLDSNEDPQLPFKVVKATSGNQGRLIGVVSTTPSGPNGKPLGYGNYNDSQNPRALGLSGRVPLKVSLENGPIQKGDWLTTSSIPGVAMKATKASFVIGRALESYDGSIAISKGTLDQEQKRIEVGIGYNPNPTPPPPGIGKIVIITEPTFYDPSIYMASSGNLNIVGNDEQSFEAWAGGYKFENKGGFADAAIARLTAGIIKTQQIVVNGTATFLGAVQMQSLNVAGALSAGSINAGTIAVSNLSIGGQALSDYIISVVQNAGFTNNSNLVAPIANIDRVNTDLISPLASGEVTINGNVKTKNLSVNGDATVSGTLRADRIIANDIEGLNARIASIAANTVTASSAAITNIYNNTYLASGSGVASGGASMIASSIDTNFANIGSLSANLAYVPSLTSDFGTFSQGLMSFGATSLADTSIAGQLSVNGSLILADNTINTLGSPLEIQPLRQGALSFMGGLVAIDIDGNLSVAGNATFAKDVTVQGTLAANIISPVPSEDLILQLPGYDDGTTLATNRPSITVKNGSGSAVLKLTDVGDVIASGAALASQFKVVRGAQADTSLITSIATASAGTATIKAGQLERTIQNSRVTADSLIYITATSDTSGKTPFVARQVAEDTQTGVKGSFTIRIPQAISLDAKVNWWIIN